MRFIIIIFSVFFSLSSICTKLRLESDGYNLEAVLIPTKPDFSEGVIEAPQAKMGSCTGKFLYDERAQIFSVEFNKNNNNCPKENLEVDIIKNNFYELYQGQRIRVNFRSELFYMRDMQGVVSLIGS